MRQVKQYVEARPKKLVISLFHVCDLECKEYTTENHPIPGRWQLGDMQFDRCPKTYVTEDMTDWVIAYQMFKHGFLPNTGGWMNQCSKFTEIMFFMSSEMAKHEREQNARK